MTTTTHVCKIALKTKLDRLISVYREKKDITLNIIGFFVIEEILNKVFLLTLTRFWKAAIPNVIRYPEYNIVLSN